MRINPLTRINISTNNTRVYVLKKNCNCNTVNNNISFGNVSWGGTIGSVIGTFAGIGLGALVTVATGGIAAPIIAGMAGAAAGGIGGDILDNKIKSKKSSSENEDSGGANIDTDFENAKMNNY